MLLGQDNNSSSGNSTWVFLLLAVFFVGYMWYTTPSAEQQAAARAEAERLAALNAAQNDEIKADTADLTNLIAEAAQDSVIPPALVEKFGDFAYSATLPSAIDGDAVTTIENSVLRISVANRGGVPSQVTVKDYQTYWKTPMDIIRDGNARLDMVFYTADGKAIHTADMYFEPSLEQVGDTTVLSMRLKASADAYLEYRYTLRPGEYMLDYTVSSKGLASSLRAGQTPVVDWSIDAFHTEKGLKYENQYTYLSYAYGAKDKVDHLSAGGSDDETVEDATWFAFKQQYFSTILIPYEGMHKATLTSSMIEDDTLYTKRFTANMALGAQNGEFNIPMKLYFGPNRFHTLDQYGDNISDLLPLGWGIFGWINRWFVIPMFDLLFYNWHISMGVVIIIMTLVIKLILSFFTYSGYKSTAKMRVLKPEMEAINEKYKTADPAKKQQAIMDLYSKAGVNPLAGCLPLLLQMPVLIAMYRFFPASIELRGQSFLWADDLSAYDSILTLPFNIPLYGAHVSLFALLMALTLLINTRMSGSMDQPQQPGMPNMKFMLYLMPVMMLLWFNSAASGLSYYYTLSTLISIVQIWVIRKYFINEDKLHAKIQENKENAKTKGPSKWQRKMDEMMKQAEEQRNRQQRRASGKK